jgi:hypothetical protein
MCLASPKINSRDEQNFDLQTDALEKAGCEKIYKEKVSGAAKFRPEFDKLFSQLREGKITGHYNSHVPGTKIRVRDWLKDKSFQEQFDYGIQLIQDLTK